MSVEPIHGEVTRFYVHSESEPGIKHMVDLSFNGGSGSCSCSAFSFTCERNIKAGKPLFSRGSPIVNEKGGISWPDATICKHIEKVHQYLLPALMKRLAAYNGRSSSGGSSHSRQTPIQSAGACQQRSTSGTAVPF